MSNPETRFGRRVRNKLPAGHDIRVENPACPGTPDLNVCINGREFWIELKQVRALPKKPDTPVFRGALRPEQKLWHRQRTKAGGKSYIVAYVELEELIYVISGEHSMEFNSMTRARLDELNQTLESIWDSSSTHNSR